MTNLKPPAKPGANATQKALNAYQSELRRYAQRLVQFEQELNEREATLDEREEEMYDGDGGLAVDDEDECSCGPQDALDGCPCPTCETWRGLHKATVAYEQSSAKQANQANYPPIGDEIDWLVKLHGLKDKRKK